MTASAAPMTPEITYAVLSTLPGRTLAGSNAVTTKQKSQNRASTAFFAEKGYQENRTKPDLSATANLFFSSSTIQATTKNNFLAFDVLPNQNLCSSSDVGTTCFVRQHPGTRAVEEVFCAISLDHPLHSTETLTRDQSLPLWTQDLTATLRQVTSKAFTSWLTDYFASQVGGPKSNYHKTRGTAAASQIRRRHAHDLVVKNPNFFSQRRLLSTVRTWVRTMKQAQI